MFVRASSNMRMLGNTWKKVKLFQHDQLSEDKYINLLEAGAPGIWNGLNRKIVIC